MKKFYVLPITAVILQSTLIGTYNASATIGSKLARAVSSVLGKKAQRIPTLLDNLTIPSDLQKKSSELIDNGYIVGASSDNFDFSMLNKVVMNKFYHQDIDKEGKLVTFISGVKPLVLGINKTEVKTAYVDENKEEKVLVTSGFPRWMLGQDIYDVEQNSQKLKTQIGKDVTEKSSLLLHAEEDAGDYKGVRLSNIVRGKKTSPHYRKEMLTESDSDGEETVELLTGKENKQKENDYKALVGKGLTNYGFEDK